VTNVASGQSVTVRVNDRGPYVQGRVVDVSHSAADALGMVGKGLANVKARSRPIEGRAIPPCELSSQPEGKTKMVDDDET